MKTISFAALVALFAVFAPGLGAQEPPPAGQPPAGPPPEPELRTVREVFTYPTFARRNPFRPLVGDAEGPRFEQLELRGILYSPEPTRRVAILSLREQPGQNPQQGQATPQETVQEGEQEGELIIIRQPSRQLKQGQGWGNVRIVEILRDRVVIQVTDFGLTEQHVMELATSPQGGSS